MTTIQQVLEEIKMQIGLSLVEDTAFPGIQNHCGRSYFSVDLGDRVTESAAFAKLERYASPDSSVISVEPNGVNRVAIFVR